MLELKPIDTTSLNIVYGEMNKTLLSVSKNIEIFAQDPAATDSISQAQAAMRQVSGVLGLLGVDCAKDMAELLCVLIAKMDEKEKKNPVYALKVLGHGLVGLTCYLDYIMDTQTRCMALIIPFINELRSAMSMPLLAESEVAGYNGAKKNLDPQIEGSTQTEAMLNALFKRVRALYQVGLLGLLNEENTQAKLRLMFRSMKRLSSSLMHTQNRTLWRLSEAVFEATLAGNLEVNFTRKRLFLRIDTALREALKSASVSEYAGNEQLIQELSYLVSVAHCSKDSNTEVRSNLSIQESLISDRVIQDQRAIMQGPSAATVSALIEVVLNDLAVVKNTLETLSEGFELDYNPSEMIAQFDRIKNVLSLVGAIEPARLLVEVCKVIKSVEGEITKDHLYLMADHILHVEGLLSDLSRLSLVQSDVSIGAGIDRRIVLSNSQLKTAERQLIVESLESLNQARQAFNAYLESGYSTTFIHDIVLYVESLKGVVNMLGHSRAAATLIEVINALSVLTKEPPKLDEDNAVFQGIADTLIALEYYLSEIQAGAKAPVSVLQVAEESMKIRYLKETV